jgi:hypothetical protein
MTKTSYVSLHCWINQLTLIGGDGKPLEDQDLKKRPKFTVLTKAKPHLVIFTGKSRIGALSAAQKHDAAVEKNRRISAAAANDLKKKLRT